MPSVAISPTDAQHSGSGTSIQGALGFVIGMVPNGAQITDASDPKIQLQPEPFALKKAQAVAQHNLTHAAPKAALTRQPAMPSRAGRPGQNGQNQYALLLKQRAPQQAYKSYMSLKKDLTAVKAPAPTAAPAPAAKTVALGQNNPLVKQARNRSMLHLAPSVGVNPTLEAAAPRPQALMRRRRLMAPGMAA